MRIPLWTPTILALVPGHVRSAEPIRIDYALPATAINGGVSQRITKCPVSAEVQSGLAKGDPGLQLEFAYKAVLPSRQFPRRLVSLDTETGFLVDRETKVHFSDDWYLKDFNGKTTGQGGALAVSIIKAGAAIYAMGANPILGVGAMSKGAATILKIDGNPPTSSHKPNFATHWYLECQSWVTEKLTLLATRRKDIETLESRQIAGDNSQQVTDLLALRRRQAGDLEEALTITSKAERVLTPVLNSDGTVANLATKIPAPDLSPWFQVTAVRKEVKAPSFRTDQEKPTFGKLLASRESRIPGLNGYQITITPDARLMGWFGCDPAGAGARECISSVSANTPIMTRDLVYRYCQRNVACGLVLC